jgi:hypothetical protein
VLKVARRLKPYLSAMTVMAALACPVFAAPVDGEQDDALTPRGTLELKTGDEAAQAGAAAAAAAHGIPMLPPGTSSAATTNTANTSSTQNTSTATPAGAPASVSKEAATPTKPGDVDLRRVVRDAAKPVLDDIAQSSVGSAVRSITSDDELDDDAADSGAAGQRRSWNGQQGNVGTDSGTGRRRTEAELANDKVKASFLFEALLKEVAPWAVAAVVLYALFYVGRVVLALRRRVKAEKRERRRQSDRRRRVPGATSSGTPTQR